MGALLQICLGLSSKLREPSAAAVPGDGPDRFSHGGDLSAGGARAARSRPAIAGSVSAGRDLRARLADGDRAARGPTGPEAGEGPSASGRPPACASPGKPRAPVVHRSVLSPA